jgi:hypothetical protein
MEHIDRTYITCPSWKSINYALTQQLLVILLIRFSSAGTKYSLQHQHSFSGDFIGKWD